MIFDLDPPRGVSPVLLGMSVNEARSAMGHWGLPEDVVGGITPGLRVRDSRLEFDVFAHFEDGSSVTAIEVWRPLGESSASVVWQGVDIFGNSADVVLRKIRDLGNGIDESDPRSPCCPDVAIGFNRTGGPEFAGPALPEFFESVLIAESGYYSVEVDLGEFS
ncbi:hypothetical protein [Amycolatopsis sp. NPDC059657]|uniref:hypothetical protein n=1 Tax=Amycolatopsis sp. NPDC059657 TaxID=3346899 RepID=UPI00366FF8C7